MKKLSQDSWSPEQDLDPVPPEYEAGVLTTRSPDLAILCLHIFWNTLGNFYQLLYNMLILMSIIVWCSSEHWLLTSTELTV
jgi:hypothetical protein